MLTRSGVRSHAAIRASVGAGAGARDVSTIRWGLFDDPFNPTRYMETCIVESWIEHL
jgi:hypothetical protein